VGSSLSAGKTRKAKLRQRLFKDPYRKKKWKKYFWNQRCWKRHSTM